MTREGEQVRLQTHRRTFFPPYAHINPFDVNEDNMRVVKSRQDSIIKAMQCEALKTPYQTLCFQIFSHHYYCA